MRQTSLLVLRALLMAPVSCKRAHTPLPVRAPLQQSRPHAAAAPAASARHQSQTAALGAAAGAPDLVRVAHEEAEQEAQVEQPEGSRPLVRLVTVEAPRTDAGDRRR